MPTNITYQNDPDDENCEVQTFVKNAGAVPHVGELVVIFASEKDEAGTPYLVTGRFFWVWADDSDNQHVTVIIKPKEN